MISQVLDPANYAFTLHAVSSMLVGAAIAVLGVYVLWKEQGSRVGLVFWVFALFVSIWLTTFGAVYASLHEPQALFWSKVSQIGVTFIPASVLALAFVIIQRPGQYRAFILSSLGVSALFCGGAIFTDQYIIGLYHYWWGYYPRFGPLGIAFIFYFISITVYVLRLYWIEYQVSTDERRRKRFKGLLVAFSIGYLASADFFATFGIPLYPFGYLPMTIFLFIAAGVIMRYRLVDITPELAAGKILETMQGAVVVVDIDGKIRVTNHVAQEMLGYQKAGFPGILFSSLIALPPEFRDIASVGASPAAQEMIWPGKEGRQVIVSVSASLVTDRDNSPVGIVYVAHDITERKRAEEDLKKRNAFIETVLHNLPIGLAVNTSIDGKAIYLNAKFEEIYGWPRHVLADVREFFAHVYPDPAQRNRMQEKILSDIASGDPARMRWDGIPVTDQKGNTRFVSAVNIPLSEQGLMISIVQDVTEQMHAKNALAEGEKRYKRLVESVTDYIYTVTVDGGHPAAMRHGPGCLSVTGYESEEYDRVPELWRSITHTADRAAIAEYEAKLHSGRPVMSLEHRIIHKNGSIRWVRNTAVPRYNSEGQLIDYDGLIADITPFKQLEEQLRQAQKMEAVGQLAGGIAHDFNNILTAIIGYGNLLQMKLPANGAVSAYAQQIITSAERAAHLTRSLLAFSRKQIIDLRPIDVNSVIRQVEKLLIRVIGEDIEFKTVFKSDDLTVLADSGQIEQVLMNLATNARDAMANGGVLTIETDTFEMNEDFLMTHGYGRPGTYVRISVSDTGTGMAEETRAKIFEPFFTTKEVGKGTGLGLAMAYGIIKQHNGYINVSSEPQKGATFKVYLPLIVHTPPPAAMAPWTCLTGGTETVLLAEDDDDVRGLMRTVLEDYGYRVIEAVDGEDAVRQFRKNACIDLIVSDIVMPKMNGVEMYQEIKKARPDMKALFTSGYPAGTPGTKGIRGMELNLVLKPVSAADLLRRVREVLDGANGAGNDGIA